MILITMFALLEARLITPRPIREHERQPSVAITTYLCSGSSPAAETLARAKARQIKDPQDGARLYEWSCLPDRTRQAVKPKGPRFCYGVPSKPR